MACDRCRDIAINFGIESEHTLRNALRVLRDNLADNTIAIRSQTGNLAPDGPLPVRLDCRFACTACGEAFTLLVGTERGVIGGWGVAKDGERAQREAAEARRRRIADFPKSGGVKAVTVASLRRSLAAAGLDRPIDAIMSAARPCVQIEPSPCSPADIAHGASRIGGDPDLPDDFDWPEHDGAPLDFICQINLAELPKGAPPELPRTGMLSFFYAIANNAWGNEAEDRGAAVVHFHDGPLAALERYTSDTPDEDEPGCHAIRFVVGLALPSPHDAVFAEVADAAMNETERDLYFDVVQTVVIDHHLMGHPGLLQWEDMRGDCMAHAKHGRERKSLDDWSLLLQLGGDSHPLGLPWDGAGRLFFWVRKQDLAARRFDRCWLTFQAT